jgi:hypothetical protein
MSSAVAGGALSRIVPLSGRCAVLLATTVNHLRRLFAVSCSTSRSAMRDEVMLHSPRLMASVIGWPRVSRVGGGTGVSGQAHSSSASRFIAGADGFFTFTQQSARPER